MFTLIVGPMKSGKTRYIIDNYYEKRDLVEIYKPSIDKRDIGIIRSRAYDDKIMNCTQICNLSEIKPQKSIIIIDEFQFFNAEELKDFVLKCKQEPIELIMSGLDLLADRTEWTSYTAIKSLCDKLIKLRAICTICGEPAEFSTLISGDKNKKIQIEGEATYEPRCKKHCCD